MKHYRIEDKDGLRFLAWSEPNWLERLWYRIRGPRKLRGNWTEVGYIQDETHEFKED